MPMWRRPKGKWGITYDYIGSCKVERCLTTFTGIGARSMPTSPNRSSPRPYKPGWEYFDVDSGSLGIWGFMEAKA